jgi:hypothetical protein
LVRTPERLLQGKSSPRNIVNYFSLPISANAERIYDSTCLFVGNEPQNPYIDPAISYHISNTKMSDLG